MAENLTFEYEIDLPQPFVADERENRRLYETTPLYTGVETRSSDYRVVDAGDDEDFIASLLNRQGAVPTVLRLKRFDTPRVVEVSFPDIQANHFTDWKKMMGGDVFSFGTEVQMVVQYDGVSGETTVDSDQTPYTTTGDGRVQFIFNPILLSGQIKRSELLWNGVTGYVWVFSPPRSASTLVNNVVGIGDTLRITPFSAGALSTPSDYSFILSRTDREVINVERQGDEVVVYGIGPGSGGVFVNNKPRDGSVGEQKYYSIFSKDILRVGSDRVINPNDASFPVQEMQVGDQRVIDLVDWIDPVTATSVAPVITPSVASVLQTQLTRRLRRPPSGEPYQSDTFLLTVTALSVVSATDVTLTITEPGGLDLDLNFNVIPRRRTSNTAVAEGDADPLLDVGLLTDEHVIMPVVRQDIRLNQYDWWGLYDNFPDDLTTVTVRAVSGSPDVVQASASGSTSLRFQTGFGGANSAGYSVVTLTLEWVHNGEQVREELELPVMVLDSLGGTPPRLSQRSDARILPGYLPDAFISDSNLADKVELGEDVVAEQHGVMEEVVLERDGRIRIGETPKVLSTEIRLGVANVFRQNVDPSRLLELANGQEIEVDFPARRVT